MIETNVKPAMPPVASYDEWLKARKRLLDLEKSITRLQDLVNAERRRLPMVAIEKQYVFDTPDGLKTLTEMFGGKRQLVVYHFMFAPEWERGCPGCTGFADALGDLSMLGERNTAFAMISRAPLEKIEAERALHGWTFTWVSSHDSDFNYDFHVTIDPAVTPAEYNYWNAEELPAHMNADFIKGEHHGMSVFFRDGDRVFHTYSAYARGVESLVHTYAMLDITPFGRQEDFEVSPPGFPQSPTYG